MEHLEELLFYRSNPLVQAANFGLLFIQLPLTHNYKVEPRKTKKHPLFNEVFIRKNVFLGLMAEEVEFKMDANPEAFMKQSEELPQDSPLIRKIFETDISAEREAESFLLVLPAGIAGHIEAGVAYGMGKKCYAVGQLEKTETLYCIFEQIFPNRQALQEWLESK